MFLRKCHESKRESTGLSAQANDPEVGGATKGHMELVCEIEWWQIGSEWLLHSDGHLDLSTENILVT